MPDAVIVTYCTNPVLLACLREASYVIVHAQLGRPSGCTMMYSRSCVRSIRCILDDLYDKNVHVREYVAQYAKSICLNRIRKAVVGFLQNQKCSQFVRKP